MHLIKLSVGSEDLASLQAWQEGHARKIKGFACHVTRMWPKREEEILTSGGSIYWVIQRQIRARQKIAGFEPVEGQDGIRRCAILLDPEIVPVAPTPRRPFQGWRYLQPSDAPPDLSGKGDQQDLPPQLSEALAELGVL